MVYGDYRLLNPDDENTYMFERVYGNKKLLVVANFTDEKQAITIPDEYVHARPFFSNKEARKPAKEMKLLPWEGSVYLLEEE